jgi:hypothetical protein
VNPPFGPFFHPSIPLSTYKHTVIQQINKKLLNMGRPIKCWNSEMNARKFQRIEIAPVQEL